MTESKLEHYRQAIQDSSDPEFLKRSELVGLLLEEGQVADAEKLIDTTLDAYDPSWKMVKEFHRTVIDALVQKGETSPLQRVVLSAHEAFPEEDRVSRMVRKAEKALTRELSSRLVPPSMSVTEWWDGPHLADTEGLVDWIPGQVTSQEQGHITLTVGQLEDDQSVAKQEWSMPLEDFQSLLSGSADSDKDLLFRHIEVGIYSDMQVIYLHPEE